MTDQSYDIVIRAGTIVDGSGDRPYVGDIAIRDGWIVATGPNLGRGTEEIDATGLLVTPGFIDLHTHYDGQLIWSDRASPSTEHGVTTVVIGNCGIGFAPCRPEHRKDLIQLMEGVEDIPGAVTDAGLTWDWETFPDYLDALERRAHNVNIGVLVPHSPVRVYVMGDRALHLEAATAEDRLQMRQLLRQGLEAGALGLGTSRLRVHRSSAGELIPSYAAEDTELTELADELNVSGKGVFQIVTDSGYASFEEPLALLVRLAKAAGRTVTYTHPQTTHWRDALRMLDEANENNDIDLKAQLLPRPIGMMLGLTATANPFSATPTYMGIADLPLADRVAEMQKPEIRTAILNEVPIDPTNPLIGFARQFKRIFPIGRTINYEPPVSQSITSLAAALGRSEGEVAYDELLKDDGHALLMLAVGNYAEFNLDWMEPMLKSPNVVLGLGDGGAHYGMICDASFTTFSLSYWTRDRSHGRIPVEAMVRRLTRVPAELMGLDDRGIIAAGYRADINVIDYDRLSLEVPCIVADLPAGGKRLSQGAHGYVATILNGCVVLRDGQPTDARPGRVIRGPQAPRPVNASM